MKKSRRFHLDVRAGYFLLLIIISICGVYYTSHRKEILRQSLGKPKIISGNENPNNDIGNKVGSIMVEVSGLVDKPGVYTLAAGSTVSQLVDMAGGLLEEVDKSNIDLSTQLFNMQEICIGNAEKPMLSRYSQILIDIYYPPTKKEEQLIEENQKININSADAEALTELPGIGPKLAESIVLFREENGDFKTIEEIMNVPKIGEKTFNTLSKYITVNDEK